MIVYKISKPNISRRWNSHHRKLDNKYVMLNSIKLRPHHGQVRQGSWPAPWIEFSWLSEMPWRFETYEELAALVGVGKVYRITDPQYG